MSKERQHCHVADQGCANPAGYGIPGRGYYANRSATTWRCPTCDEPTCRKCRKKVKGRTICNNCADNAEE